MLLDAQWPNGPVPQTLCSCGLDTAAMMSLGSTALPQSPDALGTAYAVKPYARPSIGLRESRIAISRQRPAAYPLDTAPTMKLGGETWKS